MLTVTLLTKDNEKRINATLESLSWADEIVLIDTGSSDHTLDIAKTFPNVKIHTEPFCGFGKLKQKAALLASHDWIFSLDSDEVVSDELATELQELTKDPVCVYSVPRQNYFNEKWIKACGWYPDRQVRLYNRTHTHFSDHRIDEKVLTKGMRELRLSSPILHYPFTSIADVLTKLQRDSDLFAAQHHHKQKASVLRAHLHGSWNFWKHYLFKGGLFSGAEGYIISRYMGHQTLYKYLKLRQVNLDLPPMGPPPIYDEDV